MEYNSGTGSPPRQGAIAAGTGHPCRGEPVGGGVCEALVAVGGHAVGDTGVVEQVGPQRREIDELGGTVGDLAAAELIIQRVRVGFREAILRRLGTGSPGSRHLSLVTNR